MKDEIASILTDKPRPIPRARISARATVGGIEVVLLTRPFGNELRYRYSLSLPEARRLLRQLTKAVKELSE